MKLYLIPILMLFLIALMVNNTMNNVKKNHDAREAQSEFNKEIQLALFDSNSMPNKGKIPFQGSSDPYAWKKQQKPNPVFKNTWPCQRVK